MLCTILLQSFWGFPTRHPFLEPVLLISHKPSQVSEEEKAARTPLSTFHHIIQFWHPNTEQSSCQSSSLRLCRNVGCVQVITLTMKTSPCAALVFPSNLVAHVFHWSMSMSVDMCECLTFVGYMMYIPLDTLISSGICKAPLFSYSTGGKCMTFFLQIPHSCSKTSKAPFLPLLSSMYIQGRIYSTTHFTWWLWYYAKWVFIQTIPNSIKLHNGPTVKTPEYNRSVNRLIVHTPCTYVNMTSQHDRPGVSKLI